MPQQTTKQQWAEVMQSDDEGMHACTLLLARRYCETHPKSARGWLHQGLMLHKMARYGEALPALRKALRLAKPEFRVPCLRAIARMYQYKGDFRRAERWFRKTIAADPKKDTSYIFLGGMLSRQGRYKEAKALHEQAVACRGTCMDEALLNLGLILRAEERFAEARAHFKMALQIDPNYEAAKDCLADVEHVMELARKFEQPSPAPES